MPVGGGYAAPAPPLQFVASSFAADAHAPGAGAAGGSFAAAYPPPAAFGGGGFGLPQTSYGAAVGAFAAGASSFEEELPLLEGARFERHGTAHAAAAAALTRRGGRAQSWA